MLARVPLLGAEACASAVDEVLRQRARWVRRGTGEFYTLGAASYLDDEPGYSAHAAELNPWLTSRFAPLYGHLRERLAAVLDARVMMAEGKAVPGFHIWGVPGIPTQPSASLHFDLQHQRLRWPDEARGTAARSLSFTLPLRLPRGGGGLSMWSVTHEQVEAFCARSGFAGTLDQLLPLFTERHEAYHVGELLLHSGHVLHRIAPVPHVEPGELRITLQGHGLFFAEAWHIYW